MHLKRIKLLVLGLAAAFALAAGAGAAEAQTATITINTNSSFTANSSGLLTLADTGFGDWTCNIVWTGRINSGIYTSNGTGLAQIGSFTAGSMTNCNQMYTATLTLPISMNLRADDFTVNTTTNKITNAKLALGGLGITWSGAAFGGSITWGSPGNPGVVTPQWNNSITSIYPLSQNALAYANQWYFSSTYGNSLNSDAGTVGSITGGFTISPAVTWAASVTP